MYLGIDIGGTNTKIGVVSVRGKILVEDMIETRAREGARALFRRILTALPRRDIAAVGVGCAGLVDQRRGKLLASPNLPGWEKTPLSRIGGQTFGVYTYIDNDANAAAYGEYLQGCGKGAATFVCLTLGTGVGGGIVDRGAIVRGSRNYAGEIGHMTINERGPRCKCGNRGCLEAYLGADAIVRHAVEASRRGRGVWKKGNATPQKLARAARNGNRAAIDAFAKVGAHLGTAMATLINILNPDVIGVAGGIANEFDLIEESMWRVIAERAFPESSAVASIVKGKLGFNAATLGAALLARDAVKDAPKETKKGG